MVGASSLFRLQSLSHDKYFLRAHPSARRNRSWRWMTVPSRWTVPRISSPRRATSPSLTTLLQQRVSGVGCVLRGGFWRWRRCIDGHVWWRARHGRGSTVGGASGGRVRYVRGYLLPAAMRLCLLPVARGRSQTSARSTPGQGWEEGCLLASRACLGEHICLPGGRAGVAGPDGQLERSGDVSRG